MPDCDRGLRTVDPRGLLERSVRRGLDSLIRLVLTSQTSSGDDRTRPPHD